tara:strand:+ start:400 stop:636 length:237 start_codon:yes stop_codon:yes gene_type:complete
MSYDTTEQVISDDNRYVKVAAGMVVARDLDALNDYKRKKENIDKEKGVINNIRQDVDGLKSDVSDIKMLLTKLIEDKE